MMLEQRYELAAVDQLTPHPENARRGDLEVIEGSIEHNGFFGALVAQRSSGHVLVGNHRLRAAIARGAAVVPVLWVDVDDEHARRILLVDNRANDVAGYDQVALAELLAGVLESDAGLLGTGYDDAAVAEILAAAVTPEARTDVDDVPDVATEPRSRPGDVWLLGPHRLVCGSATDVDDVRAALGDQAADLVVTDPPYGVKYTGGTAAKLKIANDDLEAAALREQLLAPAFGVLQQVLRPGGSFYVFSPSGALETTFRAALDDAGLTLRQQLVWVKDRFVLGRSDYHGQHETMLYGWQVGDEPAVPPHFDPEHETVLYGWAGGAGHRWEGGRKQSTVWEHARPARSDVHPTMKPVDLVQRAIANNTGAGDLVLDIFAGSGSTLIACHHAGRRAALVELDPKYVDVICRRYEEHTGLVPVLEATGDEVTFLEVA